MSSSGSVHSVVVKVGTTTLTDREGRIDQTFLADLAAQLCGLLDAGHRVVLVTSGAVRAGARALGWGTRPRSVSMKQAAAAVGQGRLMALYDAAFARCGRSVAQILLTRQLAQERTRYVNAQNTLNTLQRFGVVPIVNENDSVATEELQFGDNDTLAALVSVLVNADQLLLLTNVDGVLDTDGALISEVHAFDDKLRALAGGAAEHGSGGMATKVAAAEIAAAAGVTTIVARGRRPNIISDAVAGSAVGTLFRPGEFRLKGRKHWLAFGAQPRGALTLNARAISALVHEHKSLLPVGVVEVNGPFHAGETVRVFSEDGLEVARGLVSCDWQEARQLMGSHSRRTSEILGRPGAPELIHRDNLAVFPREYERPRCTGGSNAAADAPTA